jgi:RNA polymerase sigma-70 factor (ECF subfamily)
MKALQQDSSASAFEALVERYQNPLMNFIYRFVGDYDLAKDILQETFLRIFRKSGTYREIAQVSTWIYTIAGNIARTELAARKRRVMVELDRQDEQGEPVIQISGAEHSPDDLTDAEIKNTLIQNALMKLPELYREAVVLRDVQEFSYEEIVEMLGVNLGTVKSRINRGRAMLRELLKEIYNDEM